MSDDGPEVGIYADFALDHPITGQLDSLPFGFPKSFPRFDYARDPLIKDVEWTPLPYQDDGHGGSTHSINDLLSQLAEVVVDGDGEVVRLLQWADDAAARRVQNVRRRHPL